MAGRNTKLTPERAALLVALIRNGNYVETACAAAGVGVSTFYIWLQRGRAELEAHSTDLDELTNPELRARAQALGAKPPAKANRARLLTLATPPLSPYAELVEALKEAEAIAETTALANAVTAGRDDWRFWMTFLERRHPDRWGRRERFEAGELEAGTEQEAAQILDRAKEIKLKLVQGGK